MCTERQCRAPMELLACLGYPPPPMRSTVCFACAFGVIIIACGPPPVAGDAASDALDATNPLDAMSESATDGQTDGGVTVCSMMQVAPDAGECMQRDCWLQLRADYRDHPRTAPDLSRWASVARPDGHDSVRGLQLQHGDGRGGRDRGQLSKRRGVARADQHARSPELHERSAVHTDRGALRAPQRLAQGREWAHAHHVRRDHLRRRRFVWGEMRFIMGRATSSNSSRARAPGFMRNRRRRQPATSA